MVYNIAKLLFQKELNINKSKTFFNISLFQSQWMTKEYMADAIYNKFIFTIPIIWDICATYGVDNPRHVSRLLESVFAIQPQYESDAVAGITFVHEVK